MFTHILMINYANCGRCLFFLSDLNLHCLFFLPVLEAVFLSFLHVWLWVAYLCFQSSRIPRGQLHSQTCFLKWNKGLISPLSLLFAEANFKFGNGWVNSHGLFQLTFLTSLLSTTSSPAIPLDKPWFHLFPFGSSDHTQSLPFLLFRGLKLLRPL